MKVFFHSREMKEREWTPESLAYWIATHTKPGEEVVVLLDREDDDDHANVEEVWIGGCPEERSAQVLEECKKRRKGGTA